MDTTAPIPDSRWRKLQRRKVAQWALAYLAGAFAVLQGLDLVGTHFAWPGVVMRVATVAAATGVPIALVLAWYHGERGEQHVTGTELLILIALLVAAGLALRWAAGPAPVAAPTAPTAPGEPGEPVVAVLPLANLGAANDDGFVDGLHDELIARLGTVKGIAVVSRASTLTYRDRRSGAREIAAALGASHLLEGSVQRQGNHARLRLAFSDARADRQLFTRTLERELTDVFEIQALIAAETAEALRVALSSSTQAELTRRPTPSAEAYEAYLAGRAARRAGHYDDAARDFAMAVAHDPGFVEALALLCATEASTARLGATAARAAEARAHAALARLETIAPDHPMTDLAAGTTAYWIDADPQTARPKLVRALDAMPSEPAVLEPLVWISNRLGDAAAAERYLARWHTIEPGASNVLWSEHEHAKNLRNFARARAALAAVPRGQFEEERLMLDLTATGTVGDFLALAKLAPGPQEAAFLRIAQARWTGDVAAVRDALRALPQEDFHFTRFNVVGPLALYLALGDRLVDPAADIAAPLAAARAALDGLGERRQHEAIVGAWRGWIAALEGDMPRATRLLDAATAANDREIDVMYRSLVTAQLAIGYALAGDPDRALALTEDCLEMYAGCFAHRIAIDPQWMPLHKDPRFLTLVDRYRTATR